MVRKFVGGRRTARYTVDDSRIQRVIAFVGTFALHRGTLPEMREQCLSLRESSAVKLTWKVPTGGEGKIGSLVKVCILGVSREIDG